MTTNVLVIMGSVRANRICPAIARWVIGIARAFPFECELIDLDDWPLPAGDEPEIPARGIYANEHTRAWSRKITGAAAIVIVTPQYNWGYPAPLKNAIDHLYNEWKDKPVAVITYGGHGGNKCAEQLSQVLGAVKAKRVDPMPGIVLTEAMIRGGPVSPETNFVAHVDDVRAALTALRAAAAEP